MSDVEELAKLWNNRFSSVEDRLTTVEKTLTGSASGSGDARMPIYKCKGKDCGYATDDIADFVAHTVDEKMRHAPSAEAPVETEPEPRKHLSAKDYLDCPECFPKFEAEFLKRGYTKQTPKAAEAGRKETLPL